VIIPRGLLAVPGPVTNLSATWKAFIIYSPIVYFFFSSRPFFRLAVPSKKKTERPPRTSRLSVRLRLSMGSLIDFVKFGTRGRAKSEVKID